MADEQTYLDEESDADFVTGDNRPEYSVSEISQALKRTVEDSFSHVRVRGEISRLTVARSGHMYLTLKDENAVLDGGALIGLTRSANDLAVFTGITIRF